MFLQPTTVLPTAVSLKELGPAELLTDTWKKYCVPLLRVGEVVVVVVGCDTIMVIALVKSLCSLYTTQ